MLQTALSNVEYAVRDLASDLAINFEALFLKLESILTGAGGSKEIIENNNQNTETIINNQNENMDDLKNGYDDSGMASDKEKLDGVLNDYSEKEDQLLGDAKQNINEFNYDNYFDKYTEPLSDISYFLSQIYAALGALNIPIGFALTLTIALLFIGYYRFKGGG